MAGLDTEVMAQRAEHKKRKAAQVSFSIHFSAHFSNLKHALVAGLNAARTKVLAQRTDRQKRKAEHATCSPAVCMMPVTIEDSDAAEMQLPHNADHILFLQTLLDPGAAAEQRHRKAARKAAGRKRKLEDVQRRRGAGLPVKNRRRRERQ